MAASPRWKIYRRDLSQRLAPAEYVGATKYIDDAINMISASGGEIRDGHAPKRKVLCSEADILDVKGYRPTCRALVEKRLLEMDGDRFVDF